MTRLADWLPEPLTVPTRIARSLIVGATVAAPASTGASSTADRLDGMLFLAMRAATTPRSRDMRASGSRRLPLSRFSSSSEIGA